MIGKLLVYNNNFYLKFNCCFKDGVKVLEKVNKLEDTTIIERI